MYKILHKKEKNIEYCGCSHDSHDGNRGRVSITNILNRSKMHKKRQFKENWRKSFWVGGGGWQTRSSETHRVFWPYLPYSIFLAQPLLNKNDSDTLQRDLNRLQAWNSKWDMEFNPSKWQVIRVTTARNPPDTQHGQVLEVVSSARNLGGGYLL